MNLVLLQQFCAKKTAESRNPGKCAGASNTLFYRGLLCARPASRLGCVLMSISQSVSGGATLATHSGAPSAARCLSVCLTLPILFRCECQNNQIGRHWHEYSEVEFVSQIHPFASLDPGKQILKLILLSGVFFAMQGHSLTGENKQRYLEVKMMTIRLY